jgi:hypothetical protein
MLVQVPWVFFPRLQSKPLSGSKRPFQNMISFGRPFIGDPDLVER